MGQRGLGADPEFLPTQMRLMKSRQVAERVVRRLKLAERSSADPARARCSGSRSGDTDRPFDSERR